MVEEYKRKLDLSDSTEEDDGLDTKGVSTNEEAADFIVSKVVKQLATLKSESEIVASTNVVNFENSIPVEVLPSLASTFLLNGKTLESHTKKELTLEIKKFPHTEIKKFQKMAISTLNKEALLSLLYNLSKK